MQVAHGKLDFMVKDYIAQICMFSLAYRRDEYIQKASYMYRKMH